MQRNDFHFELPQDLIAQHPPAQRGDSRLLVLSGDSGAVEDQHFSAIDDLIRPGDLLVFNDTRVIPARLHGCKESGGRVEVLVERMLGEHECLAHVRASKSPKPGQRLIMEEVVELEMLAREGDLFHLRCINNDDSLLSLLEQHGHMPLPPYISRTDELDDRERYQTVYNRKAGAVAAPTAGLHFDEAMLARLQEKGVEMAYVTLHVGAGTFQPVRVDNIEEHHMHAEYIEVSEEVCQKVAATRARGGRVIAVGTTSVRSLESASQNGELHPFQGDSEIFIYPGYSFHAVDVMITNFHLPESTLLMLVSAFAGYAHVMAAYRHAVAQQYRFFSYGDAMFITRQNLTEA